MLSELFATTANSRKSDVIMLETMKGPDISAG